MVSKQRKGFLTIGLLAVSTFFVSIQTLSVSLFVLHLFLDLLFGLYAYTSFQVRRTTLLQNSLVGSSFTIEKLTYRKIGSTEELEILSQEIDKKFKN